MKPISQTPILKGLIASNQILAQPKGSVARISNLCYKKRGAMNTVDGSEIINWFNGSIQNNQGRFESIALFQPLNIARYFLTLNDAPDQHLNVPTGLSATLASGGTLVSGTELFYVVTALDGAGDETNASAEVHATPSGGNLTVNLAWTAVPNAVSYNVYRGTMTGGETLLMGAGLPAGTNSYSDNGSAVNAAVTYSLLPSPNGAIRTLAGGGAESNNVYNFTTTGPNAITPGTICVVSGVTPSSFNQTFARGVASVSGNTITIYVIGGELPNLSGGGGTIGFGNGVGPPVANTTRQLALFKMPNVGNYPIPYTDTNIVALFPPAPDVIVGGEPAGTGAGGGTTGGGVVGGVAPTPNGGVVGGTCPIPQMVQFGNTEIIALGNGFAPQTFTDPDTVAPISNTFVPAFDAWLQESEYALNSLIVPANTPWSPGVQYTAQQTVIPDTPNGFYYVCIKAGTSGASEPSFPTTIGLTVTESGGPEWLCAGSSLYYYIATQGGTSNGSGNNFTVPAFPQTIGGTVTDGSVIWTNAGLVTSAAPAPPGAAHAIVYSGTLWVGNTWPTDNANGIDGPSAIRMSDVNAPNSWNPINQAFLDKDDGTQIQGFAAFTITAQGIPPEGSLVAFKDFATYQILGIFGASNFAIQRVRTDMGCTAPRSIQFVPGFGIMRLTHLGIACFDGVNDKVMSEEIRPYLFPSNDGDTADITVMDQNYSYGAYGFQTANPPQYCLAIPIGNSGGQLTRILCYDLVTKEWGVVDLPFSLGSAVQVRAEGTIPIAMFGGFLDGVLQRWQAGDIQWYTGAAGTSSRPGQTVVTWGFRTQEMASQVADQRMYYRRVAIRGYNTNSAAGVTVVPTVNGVAGNTYVSPPIPLGDFEIFAPIALKGVRCHCDISGSGDVEIQGISFHVEPCPAGVPVVIS